MASTKSDSAANVTAQVLGAVTFIAPSMKELKLAHPDWFERVASVSTPVYCLPNAAIHALKKPGRYRAVLDPASAEAESAFTRLCERCHAIGIWGGDAIEFDLLRPSPTFSEAALLKKKGWNDALIAQARRGIEGTAAIQDRLRGYVGWLLSDPTYLREAAALAARWLHFPEQQRSAPLFRPVHLPEVFPAWLQLTPMLPRS